MSDKVVGEGISREDIVQHIAETCSVKVANVLEELMSCYGTVSGFLNASEGDLMAMYMRKRQGAKKSLGKRFFAAVDEARKFVSDARIATEQKEAAAAAEKRRELETNPVFTLAQMKSLVEFMEYCDIAKIDIKQAMRFFQSFGVADMLAGENLPAGGKAEAKQTA